MYNPLKYVPEAAIALKRCEKNSPEFKRITKGLMRDKFFMQILNKNIMHSTETPITDVRNELFSESGMASFFKHATVLSIFAAVSIAFSFLTTSYIAYVKYPVGIAVVSFIFFIRSNAKKNVHILKCIEHYLDSYKIPDAHFSIKSMIQMVLIECSFMDVIGYDSLNQALQCGCYTCKSKFTSDKMCNVDGDGLYKCPYCSKATVISERCGFEITDELLSDLHDYWLD